MRSSPGLAAALAVALAATGWLAWDRTALKAELRRVQARAAEGRATPDAAPPERDDRPGEDREPRGGRGGLGALSALGKALARAESATPGPDAAPDLQARRDRRQQRMREMFGRHPGETDAQYRSRVGPVVAGLLAGPRSAAEDKLKEALDAAQVTPEQRAALDKAMADVRAEVVQAANQAIATGDLTPYRRNSRGVLTFIGGTVGIMDGLDQRMRDVLSPEQMATLGDTELDLVEYVGLTVPWETLTPPPPEK